MVQQEEGRARLRDKLPTLVEQADWWFPPRLACEQCSSELTATYNTAPSGISTLPAADEAHRAAAPVYDLTGRRHASSAALPRGIYIGSDGKKIFVY